MSKGEEEERRKKKEERKGEEEQHTKIGPTNVIKFTKISC